MSSKKVKAENKKDSRDIRDAAKNESSNSKKSKKYNKSSTDSLVDFCADLKTQREANLKEAQRLAGLKELDSSREKQPGEDEETVQAKENEDANRSLQKKPVDSLVSAGGMSGLGDVSSVPADRVSQTIENSSNTVSIPDLIGSPKKSLYILSEGFGEQAIDRFKRRQENFWRTVNNDLTINIDKVKSSIKSINKGSSLISSKSVFHTTVVNLYNNQEPANLGQFRYVVFETNYSETKLNPRYSNNIIPPIKTDKDIHTDNTTYIVKTENDYNFYIPAYEKLVGTDEKHLPNFYILLTNWLKQEKNIDQVLLEGSEPYEKRISQTHERLLNFSGAINLQADKDEFYDVFAKNFPNVPQLNKNFVNQKMKNIVFSQKEYKLYKEFQNYTENAKREKTAQKGKKEQVPFYIKLDIGTEKFGPINQGITESGLSDLLMSYVATIEQTPGIPKERFHTDVLEDKEEPVGISDLFFKDVEEILEEVGTEGFSFDSSKITYLGELEKTIENFENSDVTLQKLFLYSIIKDLHINYKLTVEYINTLAGAKCYSETIFYKIVKKDQNNNIIQNFYIANIEDVDFLSIIDSQIKYNKEYKYEIKSYKIVLGNEYIYLSNSIISAMPEQSWFTEVSFPRMYLVETEYGEMNSIVVDKPPAPPEVEIIPFKDNLTDILIFLNTSVMEYDLLPIFFNDQEREDYNGIRRSQQVSLGERIRSGGEDRAKQFLIYRIENHPSSMDDFKNVSYEILDTNCTSAAGFRDYLEPNKKYYYIFRAVDVHNHISNPTEVYEIELVVENGMSFLRTNTVNFKRKEFKKQTKGLKRYLHIKPAIQQVLMNDSVLIEQRLNFTARQIIERNERLGLVPQSVWGKKFKLRIKSNNTKKFIDIYFTFKQSKKPEILTILRETCD